MSTPPRTFDFRSYLQAQTGCSSWMIEELVGGTANHTARVRRAENHTHHECHTPGWVSSLKGSSESVIMKQAPPYLAKSPDLSCSPKRQVIEAEALKFLHTHTCVSNVFKQNPNIRVPKLLHHDLHNHVLVQSDLGSHPNLHDVLTSPITSTTMASKLGYIIGKFLVALGESLRASSIKLHELQTQFQNDDSDQLLEDVIMKATDLMMDAGIQDVSHLRCRAFDHRHRDEKAAFGQGDIWFGTILVQLEAEDDPIVGLCDWEFAGPTGFANDVAQLGAYLHVLSESPLITADAKGNITACAKEMYAAYLEEPKTPEFLRSLLIVHGWELLVAVGWKARQYLWCSCPGDGLKCRHIRQYVQQGAQILRAAGDLETGPNYEAINELTWFSLTGFASGFRFHRVRHELLS